MEVKDFSSVRNDLFNRDEVKLVLNNDKNPGFEEVKKLIVEQSKKEEANIDVYNVKGKFGSHEFEVLGYIYDSEDDLKKAEQKTKKQRVEEKKVAEEGAKEGEEAKAEEPKVEEKPAAEEKKE